jgi:hypothetical protein
MGKALDNQRGIKSVCSFGNIDNKRSNDLKDAGVLYCDPFLYINDRPAYTAIDDSEICLVQLVQLAKDMVVLAQALERWTGKPTTSPLYPIRSSSPFIENALARLTR